RPHRSGMRALALSLFLFSSIAQANGRMAGAFQIVSKPGDDKVLLARTTFGVFLSTDRAAHWDWICEGAVGYGGKTVIEDPSIALTTGGAQIIGVQRGLATSPTGCDWTYAFEGKPVIDVTVAKSIPGSAYAISAVALGDGGSGP